MVCTYMLFGGAVDPIPPNLTALVGNGVSIAYDRRLMLNQLCDALARKLKLWGKDGEAVERTIRRIAVRAGTGDPRQDFEALVGPFGTEAVTLLHLEELARYVDPSDAYVSAALQEAARFARQVGDIGTSHVLEEIVARSRADCDKRAGLDAFMDTMVENFSGTITIANLNYDSLALASLSHQYDGLGVFCDQGHGFKPVTIRMPDGVRYTTYELRKGLDFPNRVRLVHLHGSVTFWDRGNGQLLKLPIEAVRSPELWQQVRENPAFTPRPQVVLASQADKSSLILREPFALAYRELVQSLDRSDHWLIVGYSFRDACVNQQLADAFARKVTKPEVLVVTYGPDPEYRTVVDAFGWNEWYDGPADWLTINRDGADAMVDSDDWKRFSGQPGTWRLAS